MFDTMTVTKAAAGLFGAFLALLLAKWAAETVYHVGGHGDEPAYAIEVAEAEEASGTEETVSFEELMASADAAKGEKVFKKCAACHKVNGEDATGPHLDGVVGRAVASVAGFGYSGAMQGHGGDWTPEALDEFLTKPSAAVPGTSMSFSGLKKQGDRVDLIAYLQSVSN
ncbi:cytochrome c family protein [Ruegeria pomeroyi]|jgi:cytochrome c|uniref:Cytochrome c552 n=2 Tax=Ruegeria pomeroyi TaxID=89184 RepID=Q5LMM5_RUEPO|nr:cytochrome c family protein [Ruegeria pomeroyi]HCE72208.1 cytochrome c family protein [Ruegeria sp.]AAV96763.1 cytochrome c552 [Ruegeria pomeroyi DSS-3]NVK96305.1 cytochrome c family protein [Ruegeria pomeroyi]NVL00251.1 cytochrome c family protein [Ruegeria pomeroyi]QWV10972.1 cytochrome c family protein [Ruegeria pomeroyi]